MANKVKKAPRVAKERVITVRLSVEAYDLLRAKADDEDRKIAWIARRAILDDLGLDTKAA